MTAASAYSPPPSEPGEGRPSEPSMEDILASIRRIIADDQNGGGKPAYGNAARRPAVGGQASSPDAERGVTRTRTPYDDVLDLARLVPSADRSAATGRNGAAAAPPVQHASSDVDEETTYRTESQEGDGVASVAGLRARLPEPAGRGAAQEGDHEMLDHTLPAVNDDAEDGLLSAPLGDSVMSAFEALAATVVLQNTPMLERVMRDLLRPMLKTWLDDNLPPLVERLVRSEIERVARGSRG